MSAADAWCAAQAAMNNAKRATVARKLQRDPSELFALAPFIIIDTGESIYLGAIETIPTTDEPEPQGDLILINPADGSMLLYGSDGGHIVGENRSDGALRVYTNGVLLARDWAKARAEWLAAQRAFLASCDGATAHALALAPPADGIPGVALCGPLSAIRDFGPLRTASRLEVDSPRMVKPIADALLRSARLPIVDAQPARLRAVA